MTQHDAIAMSSGHGKYIRGASGAPVPPQLDEVDEARRVVDRMTQILAAAGVMVKTFHDNTSHDQNTNLNTIVDWHNRQSRTLDVSVHFNAYDGSAHGVEVLYVTQEALARQVSAAIAEAGHFTDRGPKYRSDLFVLNNTDEPAILIETCFCDSTSDSNLYREHFEAVCQAISETIAGRSLGEAPPPIPPGEIPTPPERPDNGSRATIAKGDTGPDVVHLQEVLSVLKADGDFGSITDTWVTAFQSACGIAADGIVGPVTWAEIDALEMSVEQGDPRLPKGLADKIYTLAMASEIADYSWRDRGMPPPAYIAGVAQAFGYAVTLWRLGDRAVRIMADREGEPDIDALAYYHDAFRALGMSNDQAGLPTLRHLFVLMMGLGMRESSGRYCEGRDLSASNVQSETAEAGLFQTSWNIKAASSAIPPLLEEFWANPTGFLGTFKEGVSATANNLNCYGSGDGVQYQWLSRFAPLFHVMVTGVGLRKLRSHWGPIGRREVEIKREADELLMAVQDLVEASEAVV